MVKRNRRGSNAIEFALTAPILFLSMLGLFECGWFFCNAAVINEITINLSRNLALNDLEDMDIAFSEEFQIAKQEWLNTGLPGEPHFEYEIYEDRVFVYSVLDYKRISPIAIFEDEILSSAASFIFIERF